MMTGSASYFNPLPPCGGRPEGVDMKNKKESISIHSLRVEGDASLYIVITSIRAISIHSLRVEGDRFHLKAKPLAFISIHSLRVEGDPKTDYFPACSADFNPLPPCGGRLSGDSVTAGTGVISIHSLRVEGDTGTIIIATRRSISIHSLRVEGDLRGSLLATSRTRYFNPLPPCGGRH